MNDDLLTPDDWYRLVRLLALHDLRTPARLIEHLKSFTQFVDRNFKNILLKHTKEIEEGISVNSKSNAITTSNFPLKITTSINDCDDFGTIAAETTASRASWLWTIEQQLNESAKILHQHKWRIMRPAEGFTWFTTDKPVVRLNFYNAGKYDYNGGWNSKGSEIFMPLSPGHMLYTRIGHYPPMRNARFSVEQTQTLSRIIAQHAHREIYSHIKDPDLHNLAPRMVNAQLFKSELEEWKRFHDEQTESDRYFFEI